jgi:hypothetical protein
MFIAIETDMCLKKIVQAENIREWIKDASLVDKNVFRIISVTKSFPRVSFSFHERNTIENKIKTLITPNLTKLQPPHLELIDVNIKCQQTNN